MKIEKARKNHRNVIFSYTIPNSKVAKIYEHFAIFFLKIKGSVCEKCNREDLRRKIFDGDCY